MAGLAALLLAGLAPAQQNAPARWTANSTPMPQNDSSLVTPPPVIQQTAAMQRGSIDTRVSSEEAAIQDIAIQLSPPSPDRLFKLESERQWRERVRQEGRQRNPPDRSVVFPEEAVLTSETYQRRNWPMMAMVVEPYWVGYEKLYFEQKNGERYGWDLGPIQPVISAGYFFAQLITLPYNAASDPLRCYEFNSGYCLPGDPVPLFLYPIDVNLTGTVAEAATVLAVLAIFP